jgi:hypothetical protein
MPNWCYNNLTIDGTTKGGKILADAFRPKYKDEDGNLFANPFQDLMPIPEDLQIEAGYFGDGTDKNNEMQERYARNKEKYGHQHWYDWCIANWGTKWDARVEDFNAKNINDICVYFETAWSPPLDFLSWFCEQHPDTVFSMHYDEEGCFFEGECYHNPDDGFNDDCWTPVSRVEDESDLELDTELEKS